MSEFTQIYVVLGSTGEYSDRSEWLVYAFADEKQAQDYVTFLTAKRAVLADEAGRANDEDWVTGDWLPYEAREAVAEKMRAYDPGYSEDYTGTRWWVQAVDFAPPEVLSLACGEQADG